MRLLFFLLALAWPSTTLAQSPPEPADDLRRLSRAAQELRADVGQSYRRLAAIATRLRGDDDAARFTITHRDEVGPFYRLVEITYALDGVQLVHRRDESGALARHRVEVHDGLLRPGDHTLSVVLRYVGEGGELISYLRGYRFAVRSSHAFMAPPGRHVRLEVRAFTRGPDVPYEDRLGVSFRASIEELR